MPNPADFENQLRDLSQRQCQILYWVCQGLTFKEVSVKIGYGEDLVTAEMSRIYRTFGLTQQRRNVKRKILEDMICPLHLQRVSDPDTDCREHVIEVNAPPPDPIILQEVREDAQTGLIPLKGALVPVGKRQDHETKRPKGELAPRPTYPLVRQTTPSKGNPLVWVLVGVLGTLLVLTLCILGVVFSGRGNDVLTLLQPTGVPVFNTVIVTQPPIVIAQPGATSLPGTPIIQTVVVTQAPPVPPARPTPQGATIVTCNAGGETVNVVGKVAGEIPGTELCLGASVTSVVDSKTRPFDVYAFNLEAGKEVLLKIVSDTPLCPRLYNPSSKSIAAGNLSHTGIGYCTSDWTDTFTPAVSGKYHFSVGATSSGQRYTFSLSLTGQAVPANQIANDIPGTSLRIGESRTSVVDSKTKPNDVYALDLEAGKEVLLKIISDTPLCPRLYNPSSKSIAAGDVSHTGVGYCTSNWNDTFVPAVSGTYYLEVRANGTGQIYTLTITLLE